LAAHDGSSVFAQPQDGSDDAAQVPDSQLEQVLLEQELQLLDSPHEPQLDDEQP
jgi:hypothetical protein